MATGAGPPTVARKKESAFPARPNGSRRDPTPGPSKARQSARREGGCLGAPHSTRNRAVPPIDYPISVGSGAPRTPPTSCVRRGTSLPRTTPLVNSSTAQLRCEGLRHLLEAGLGLDQIRFE